MIQHKWPLISSYFSSRQEEGLCSKRSLSSSWTFIFDLQLGRVLTSLFQMDGKRHNNYFLSTWNALHCFWKKAMFAKRSHISYQKFHPHANAVSSLVLLCILPSDTWQGLFLVDIVSVLQPINQSIGLILAHSRLSISLPLGFSAFSQQWWGMLLHVNWQQLLPGIPPLPPAILWHLNRCWALKKSIIW